MAPDAPDHRDGRAGLGGDLCCGRGDAAAEIEGEKPPMTEPVLDIVAEDVEIEEVAGEVQPAAVQEHRGDEGRIGRHPESRGASSAAPVTTPGISPRPKIARCMRSWPSPTCQRNSNARRADDRVDDMGRAFAPG
jgi:hypothetical protein